MGLILTEKHLDLMALALRPQTKLIVSEGTIRSSKTVVMINTFYLLVRKSPDRLHCLAAKDYDAIRDNLLECNGLGLLDLHPDVHMVKPSIGSPFLAVKGFDRQWKKILLAGYAKKDQWKKILGKTIGVFLIDEVNIADKTFIEETYGRQTSSDYPKMLYTLNGDDPKHFIYQEHINYCKPLGKVPPSILGDMLPVENKPGYYYYHWTMWDNPIMTPEKIAAAEQIYPKDSYYYTIKIKGERGIAEGLIFPIFSQCESEFIIDKPLPFTCIVLGVDFGGNGSKHSFVAVGYGPNYDYLEYLEVQTYIATGMDPNVLTDKFEEFVRMVRKKYGVNAVITNCDSAEQTLMNGFKTRTAVKNLGAVIQNALKAPINDRINFITRMAGARRIKWLKGSASKYGLEAYKTAVWDSRPGHINERLDNGTCEVDVMDSSEYAFEKKMKDFIMRMEV